MNFDLVSPDAFDPELSQPTPRAAVWRGNGLMALLIYSMAPLFLLCFAGTATSFWWRGTPAKPGPSWEPWMLLYAGMGVMGALSAWSVWRRMQRDLELVRRGLARRALVSQMRLEGKRQMLTLQLLDAKGALAPEPPIECEGEPISLLSPLQEGDTVSVLFNPDRRDDFLLYRDSWYRAA